MVIIKFAVYKVWMILVWQIACDSPNSPNFLPAKLRLIRSNSRCRCRLKKGDSFCLLAEVGILGFTCLATYHVITNRAVKKGHCQVNWINSTNK